MGTILKINAFNHKLDTNRRTFITTSILTTWAQIPNIVNADSSSTTTKKSSPTIYTTTNGVKYAIINKSKKDNKPLKGDFVAIEYTGYLINGKIFDATHSKGKSNALLFQLGSTAVIPGINEVILQGMDVGDSIQAIIPSDLAYGSKGICIDGEGCLIEPGSTLVYDIYLKKSSIPPP